MNIGIIARLAHRNVALEDMCMYCGSMLVRLVREQGHRRVDTRRILFIGPYDVNVYIIDRTMAFIYPLDTHLRY